MSVLKILKYPNKYLRKKADIIKNIDINIDNIINDMFDTMYFYKGIGLAATQINIHKQIIVIDIYSNKKNKIVLINPKIVKKDKFILAEEGCLSIPDYFCKIIRYSKITVEALDKNGNLIKIKAKNLLSSCIQHEIDHLLGILIIDYNQNNNIISNI